VEKFAEIPELGRFVLVKNGRNIGAGVVLGANFKEREGPKRKE
jgi:translation elongation factor EF-1alpha